MKSKSLKNSHWIKERQINPYIAEARARERRWNEFKMEIELVGAQLRRVRLNRGYTIATVANALKMSKRRLDMIECGAYKHFTTPDLYRLCQFYETTTTEVLSVTNATFQNIEPRKIRSRGTECTLSQHQTMTKLGEYLLKRAVNKAIVARKTGLSKQRIGELTLNA
jgi:transcriptional regulator with XRE-family HTH domain